MHVYVDLSVAFGEIVFDWERLRILKELPLSHVGNSEGLTKKFQIFYGLFVSYLDSEVHYF